MPEEQVRPVSILFRTPASDRKPFHVRTLTGVPLSKAEAVAEDFTDQGPESEVSPHQIYRYTVEEEERLLALDFNEVVAVLVGDSFQAAEGPS